MVPWHWTVLYIPTQRRHWYFLTKGWFHCSAIVLDCFVFLLCLSWNVLRCQRLWPLQALSKILHSSSLPSNNCYYLFAADPLCRTKCKKVHHKRKRKGRRQHSVVWLNQVLLTEKQKETLHALFADTYLQDYSHKSVTPEASLWLQLVEITPSDWVTKLHFGVLRHRGRFILRFTFSRTELKRHKSNIQESELLLWLIESALCRIVQTQQISKRWSQSLNNFISWDCAAIKDTWDLWFE